MQRAVVEDFEEDRWEKSLFVCDGRGRSSNLEHGLESKTELTNGEVLREYLLTISRVIEPSG